MAVDIFLTIPNIPGESVSDSFPSSIQVLSYSWGLSSSVNIGSGSSGAGAGKAQASDLSIMKSFDVSSPLLMAALATGKSIPKITLSLVKAGKDSKAFLTYEFDNVFVTSVQDSASDEVPTESISFAAQKVIVKYYKQNSDGSYGNATIFSFDFSTNKST